MMKKRNKIVTSLALAGLGGLFYLCLNKRKVKIPNYVEVIEDFDTEKYMGKWYEIARIDFKYEKNLKNVSATYLLNKNGIIEVHNRGFDYINNKWKDANGKANFNGEMDKGALKVSFFGPFFSGYNIVMMEPDYETALVFGENHDYLWILSREKTISKDVKQKYLNYAQEKGYNTANITWTIHD